MIIVEDTGGLLVQVNVRSTSNRGPIPRTKLALT